MPGSWPLIFIPCSDASDEQRRSEAARVAREVAEALGGRVGDPHPNGAIQLVGLRGDQFWAALSDDQVRAGLFSPL